MPVGPQEVLIIGLVIAVLFGAKKLPQIGQGMGEGIRNFKASIKDIKEELTPGDEDDG